MKITNCFLFSENIHFLNFLYHLLCVLHKNQQLYNIDGSYGNKLMGKFLLHTHHLLTYVQKEGHFFCHFSLA